MIIKNIILYNYRLYKGENKIDFSPHDGKNIFLISGENGFGKTTFLHSLIWCLYGKLMTDVEIKVRKDVNNSGYNSFLRCCMNNAIATECSKIDENIKNEIRKKGYTYKTENLKKITQYFVSIEFSNVIIPSLPCTSIRITRSYDIVQDKENVEILIDNMKNELTNEIGSNVFINDFILNKDIAQFFFFDSEQIVSLAETKNINDRRRLCSAYNEVLGVKKYEDLKKNLENVRLRFRRKSSDIVNREKLINLIEQRNLIKVNIGENNKAISTLETTIKNLRDRDLELQLQLMREGSSVTTKEIDRLKVLIDQLKKKNIEYRKQLKLFLDYAPLAIIGHLLEDTKKQIESDHKQIEFANNQLSRNIIVSDISSELSLLLQHVPIDNETSLKLQYGIQNILDKYKGKVSTDDILLTMSDSDYEEFVSIYNNITTTYRSEFVRLADDYRKNKQMLERNSRRLSNINNKESDELIKSIRKKKEQVEKNIEDEEIELHRNHEISGTLNQELAIINQQITELSKLVSLNDDDALKDKLACTLIDELSNFLFSLKQEKKYSLERRIKSSLNNLMHKDDFIGDVEVVISGEDMDIELYTVNHTLIDKDTLSKGEQQLYATSILKALVDESGIQFPVFIDSPLQKFDKSHAAKIITEFYPEISKQVILFPLPHKELTLQEYEIMKPHVNATYLIKNDTSCSYFKEIAINDYLK